MHSDLIDQKVYNFFYGDFDNILDIEFKYMAKPSLEEWEELLLKIFPDQELTEEFHQSIIRVNQKIIDASYRNLRKVNPEVADSIDRIHGVLR